MGSSYEMTLIQCCGKGFRHVRWPWDRKNPYAQPTGSVSVEKIICKIYEPLTEITHIDQMRVFLFNKGKEGLEAPH